jgi:transcriptional regulator with XRE-family HTH domain
LYGEFAILGLMQRDEIGGRLIRRARLAAGLTQAELAARAAQPQSVVSAYETGSRQPSATALARLVEAAGYQLLMVPAARRTLEPEVAGRQLTDVLDLAEQLPRRRRPSQLGAPRLPERPKQ